ncbi:hypothetical protein QBZ16_000083 [Prototheca wickerhamii]|uniref:Kinesin motor domain-containing protein n=1 Tax=Prototheca wickerhamii TaxID=3111 RepID=A0AAD9IMN7_PROWI|nr:hypothetical protein QBZ16_000083 [Prototheca wickerhamii]
MEGPGQASVHTSADSEVPKSESVCVAVHVRPLIEAELLEGCESSLSVTPGLPQVGHGSHRFSFDHVFGGDAGRPSWELYGLCVAPLVAGLFQGYNATVFAYGQTGSGKTFTMGSAGFGAAEEARRGVIPRACALRVGFVEIHNEEIRDLLAPPGSGAGVKIREVPGQGVCLAGATEIEVATRDELLAVLEAGTSLRATAATGMNRRSSRSHAIFSITVELRRDDEEEEVVVEDAGAERISGAHAGDQQTNTNPSNPLPSSYLCAKLHLVDLAGSERAKRTGATGARLQEGIEINRGLSELGNVINALAEGKAHVPYRNSKLTRMLQDSLGGNSRTLMLACVSPADVNLEESLNTLRYAARARAIRNRPVVNRDPVSAEIAHLRQQLAAARLEAARLRQRLSIYEGGHNAGGGGACSMGAHNALGEQPLREDARASSPLNSGSSRRMRAALRRAQDERDAARAEAAAHSLAALRAAEERAEALRALAAVDAQAAARLTGGADGSDNASVSLPAPAEAALRRVAELEAELSNLKNGEFHKYNTPVVDDNDADGINSDDSEADDAYDDADPFQASDADRLLVDARESAHASEVASVQSQLRALESALSSKQRAMAAVSGHAALRQAFTAQLAELAAERDELARERLELQQRLVALAHESEEERARLSAAYHARITELDGRLRGLRRARRLERDIGAIKAAKVALQRRAEAAAREHLEWRRARDRELQALRKEGRAAAASLHRLQALSSKQQAVLRRKTEEAEAARRRLKDLEGRQLRWTAGGAGAAEAQQSGCGWCQGRRAYQRARRARGARRIAQPGLVSEPVQPNALAPLLRDERARQDWLRQELDRCEGPEPALARLPRRWPGARASRRGCGPPRRGWPRCGTRPGEADALDSASEAALRERRRQLAVERDACAREVGEALAALRAERAAEERRGAGAADPRRWAGVRSASEARTLLRSAFAPRPEAELLRLRLEAAEQDKMALELGGELGTGPAATRPSGAEDVTQLLDAMALAETAWRAEDDSDAPAPDATDRAAAQLLARLEAATALSSCEEERDFVERVERQADEESGRDPEHASRAAAASTPGSAAQARKRSLFLSRTGAVVALSSPVRSAASTPGSHSLEPSDLFGEEAESPAASTSSTFSLPLSDSDDDDFQDDSDSDAAYSPSHATPGATLHQAALLDWLNAWRGAQGQEPIKRLTVARLREQLASEGELSGARRSRASKAELLAALEEQSEEARTRAAALKAAIEQQLRKGPSALARPSRPGSEQGTRAALLPSPRGNSAGESTPTDPQQLCASGPENAAWEHRSEKGAQAQAPRRASEGGPENAGPGPLPIPLTARDGALTDVDHV